MQLSRQRLVRRSLIGSFFHPNHCSFGSCYRWRLRCRRNFSGMDTLQFSLLRQKKMSKAYSQKSLVTIRRSGWSLVHPDQECGCPSCLKYLQFSSKSGKLMSSSGMSPASGFCVIAKNCIVSHICQWLAMLDSLAY